MKVLVACEESQAVTIELRKLGHEAYSCDIIGCSGGHPEWHIQGDALEILNPVQLFKTDKKGIAFITCDGAFHGFLGGWDMIIAHPPCTYLTNAGARHLWKGHQLNQERYAKGMEAKEFFMAFLNADCPKIAVENPIPSRVFELPKYTQTVQPYEYGHPYTKKTCFWLKGLDPLVPTNIVEPEATWCPSGSYSGKHCDKHRGVFTKDRARNRSKTFYGIAKAMAEQWAGKCDEVSE